MKYNIQNLYKSILLVIFFLNMNLILYSQAPANFVHPGGLHTTVDLDRMKQKVLANQKPWIDGWNLMITDFKGQSNYVAKTYSDIGGKNGERQQAVRDADAAYFNALQWYVSGNTANADCAVRILNAWATNLQSANGELFMLPIPHMVEAAEVLRIYPGWVPADFNKFKAMCRNIFYPACKGFINGCGSWSGWDGPANAGILEMGVFLDDATMFNEAVNYFKTGAGGGNINNMICQPSGQISEMGRDQPHALIGPAFMANMCQFAWNQGVDLFGYNDNMLLKGFEYYCKYNLNNPIDWIPYNDCKNNNFYFPSHLNNYRIYNNPILELVYNHYKQFKNIEAPYTQTMINLAGLVANNDDNLGYKALTYTLPITTSIFDLEAVPAAPTKLNARSGINKVYLTWNKPAGSQPTGYTILRTTTPGGPYATIATWNTNTATSYIDTPVSSGVTYYYTVSAHNKSGESSQAPEVKVQAVKDNSVLPNNWTLSNIGTYDYTSVSTYANVENRSFVVNSYGTAGIGGTADSNSFLYTNATGDFTITARFSDAALTGSDKDKFGLMIRESLATDSKMSSITAADSENRFVWFVNRANTGGTTPWVGGDTHTRVASWFRLERKGNIINSYQSDDGVLWFKVGASNITMNSSIFAGLFVASGVTGGTTSITFDNVTITGAGLTVPAAPTNLSGLVVNSAKNSLTWSSVANALYYTLLRSTTTNGSYETLATNITSTSYDDNGLADATKYYYKVKAVNFAGESAVSNEINLTTSALALPSVPVGFTATSGNLNIILSWNATDQASSYVVKRSTSANGTFITIATVSTMNYVDSSVTSGQTYYYKLVAANTTGEGPESNLVSAKVSDSLKFTGTIIGTSGSYNNDPTRTMSASQDGNLGTFFDSDVATGAWSGLDLGVGISGIPTAVRYAPRSGYPGRILGGIFQGANNGDFIDAVTIFTVGVSPAVGVLTEQSVLITQKFRYFRFVSSTNGYGNVAEIEFWGQLTNTLRVEDFNQPQNDLQLYPNPSKDKYFSVNLGKGYPSNGAHVKVYDLSGNLVLEKSIDTQSARIDHNLNSGVYMVKIENSVMKLIIVK